MNPQTKGPSICLSVRGPHPFVWGTGQTNDISTLSELEKRKPSALFPVYEFQVKELPVWLEPRILPWAELHSQGLRRL